MKFSALVQTIRQTHEALKWQAVKAINRSLTIRNWLFGLYLVEYEQRGEDRAQYGNRLLKTLVRHLKERKIKGLTAAELSRAGSFTGFIPRFLVQCPKNCHRPLPEKCPLQIRDVVFSSHSILFHDIVCACT